MRSKCKARAQQVPLTDDKGRCLDETAEITEEFNSYFTSVLTTEDLSNVPEPVKVCGAGGAGVLRDFDIIIGGGRER